MGHGFGAILVGSAFLDYPSALHDEVAVGEGPGEVEILLDDQDRDVQLLADAQQGILDLLDDIGLDAFGGFVEQQQLRLARAGKRLRVLISYGEYWFPWYMRRLAERPANVWFVLKNLK